MHIDEERVNVLTKIMKKRKTKVVKIKESDHNTINVELDIEWKEDTTTASAEVFNFNDSVALKTFKTLTTNTNQMSKIVDIDKNLNVQTKKILKRLNGFVNQTFKKVKITNNPDVVLEKLYDKRRVLRSQTSEKSKAELAKVDAELAEKYSEKMYRHIKEEIEGIDSEDGGFNSGKLWKLKKKLSPNSNDPPTAMKDSGGKLLTTDEEVKKEAMKHYQQVFQDKPMEEDLKHLKDIREDLCHARVKHAKKVKTPPWSKEDVICVLKSLKPKISKDPYEMPNELFLFKNAGEALIFAITKLINKMKDQTEFPECLRICNVTNAFKNKGDQTSFDSYRGLFRTPVFRNILDKLLYFDMYETIDESLTDCNVGSRKKRNICDNLFVINAISSKSKQKNN